MKTQQLYLRKQRRPLRCMSLIIILASSVASAEIGAAETCNVPSVSYPSIQSAVNVINCTEIVLISGSFYGQVTIGRTLEIQGTGSGSTTIVGKVTVSGSGTQAFLTGLKVAVGPDDLPHNGLVVGGDAEIISDDLVVGSTDKFFADGFERGDTTAWSNTVP